MPALGTRGGLSARGFGFGYQAGGITPASVFDIDLWTGTSATNAKTTPFTPNMVWIKCRSNALDNALFDTSRGAGSNLSSNTTNAALGSGSASVLTSFDVGGYTLSSDPTYAQINYTGYTYVGWAFKEAAGFFDVVTYTGTGSAQSIAHSLGSTPGMFIVKDYGGTNSWYVYHTSVGNTKALLLNSTLDPITSSGYWNNTSPTSSVFTVGADNSVNQSTHTYVAYLFAQGTISECGSFTTNSSGNATVTLGIGEPQWVLAKTSSTTGDWIILDTTRGWGATDYSLFPNLSNAESSATNYGAPSGTGFTWANGGNTVTWVYCAIKKP